MSGPECAELRQALGVYVLGAIEPAERAELDAHLTRCPSCRDELAALAGLPALLGRVSADQLEAQPDGPGGRLLEGTLAGLAAERRRRRRRNRALAAVVGAVLVAVAVGSGVFSARTFFSPEPGASPSAAPAAAPSPSVSANDPRTQVSAAVALTPKAWGTAVTVRMSGLPKYASCRLVAVGPDERRDVAASWQVSYKADALFHGSTAIQRDDLRRLEVVTDDGRSLLTIPIAR